jgi:response regulator RpfG family c-di-GMP phosphodiesterase
MSQAGRHVILLVDDEEMIILSIQGLLSLDDEYDVFTYTSPREALQWIQANHVDLIVSDYLMPEIDGFEFLSRAKKVQPNAIRILLTGYADKENAIRAINELGLFQYVEKPWQNDDFKRVIKKGVEKRMLLKRLGDAVEKVSRARKALLDVEREINSG